MKNSSSQSKPLIESWKFRCQQQCPAKYRQRAVGKPTAVLEMTHYSPVHKMIPLPQAMKIPDAKAAVVK